VGLFAVALMDWPLHIILIAISAGNGQESPDR
jgi:hypothetical protein